MIRQSSFVILQIWSIGLNADELVVSTLGTICFKYRRKKSPRQELPLVAVMYFLLLPMIVSAASSNVATELLEKTVSRFEAAFFKCRFMYSAFVSSLARLAMRWEGTVIELEMLSTLS